MVSECTGEDCAISDREDVHPSKCQRTSVRLLRFQTGLTMERHLQGDSPGEVNTLQVRYCTKLKNR